MCVFFYPLFFLNQKNFFFKGEVSKKIIIKVNKFQLIRNYLVFLLYADFIENLKYWYMIKGL